MLRVRSFRGGKPAAADHRGDSCADRATRASARGPEHRRAERSPARSVSGSRQCGRLVSAIVPAEGERLNRALVECAWWRAVRGCSVSGFVSEAFWRGLDPLFAECVPRRGSPDVPVKGFVVRIANEVVSRRGAAEDFGGTRPGCSPPVSAWSHDRKPRHRPVGDGESRHSGAALVVNWEFLLLMGVDAGHRMCDSDPAEIAERHSTPSAARFGVISRGITHEPIRVARWLPMGSVSLPSGGGWGEWGSCW